ncbi:hypothetical protein ACFVWG_35350 [Kribbella sp. NPDC058245]|uniref:hypothetical protein n=1 Tax=Kribbella sp. NPDC058245 TaxID=3346399 RepID=UPI0036E96D45
MGSPSADDAAAALDDVRRSQAKLAAGLQLPKGFYGNIGLAIAVQIFLTARSLSAGSGKLPVLAFAGVLVFAVVAWIQIVRFRRLNGARVRSLISRLVLGTGALSSLTYGAALAGALWAALGHHWWLSGVCSIAGGAGYVAGGMRWMRLYRADPQSNGRNESAWWLAAVVGLAVAGLLLLAAGS